MFIIWADVVHVYLFGRAFLRWMFEPTIPTTRVGFATFKKVIATLLLLPPPRIIVIAILLPYKKVIAIATIILRSNIATFRYFFATFHIILSLKIYKF